MLREHCKGSSLTLSITQAAVRTDWCEAALRLAGFEWPWANTEIEHPELFNSANCFALIK